MIDPDNIILVQQNKNNKLTINSVPEFDLLIWDFEEDKEVSKFYKTVEKEVRNSFEYREMIQYLRKNCGMDQCAFIKVSNADNFNIKIEIHHYPFTLYDIVLIVFRKRQFYQESMDLQMVAKEVTLLHYKVLVGLIPLSKTAHQLVHDGKLFIPVDNVFGRFDLFVEIYKPFCETEQLETLERIKMYSREYSDLHDTTVFNMNNIYLNPTVDQYKLPDFVKIEKSMYSRIDDIKKNNYILPTLDDYKEIDKTDSLEDRKMIIKPIRFI